MVTDAEAKGLITPGKVSNLDWSFFCEESMDEPSLDIEIVLSSLLFVLVNLA